MVGRVYENQVTNVQYGLGENGRRHDITGLPVGGDVTMSEEELTANRANFGKEIREHPLIDDYFEARIPDFSKIEVPLLSSGNWGGHGLHLRGQEIQPVGVDAKPFLPGQNFATHLKENAAVGKVSHAGQRSGLA